MDGLQQQVRSCFIGLLVDWTITCIAPRDDKQERQDDVQPDGRPQQRPDPFAADGKILIESLESDGDD